MQSLKNYPQQDVDIIIASEPMIQFLKLNELIIFPDRMDGLHIWEAGIVLARYIYHNPENFFQKDILELGTGVGIVGIAALKYTKCSSVILSDYKEEILNNAIENSKRNGVYKENTTKRLLLDWKEYAKLEKKYDVIVASDVIYAGAPVAELAKLLDKALNKEGKAYILIPKQRFFAIEFFKAIDELNKFDYDHIELDDPKYLISPYHDESEGFKHFAGLKELNFFVYRFTKTVEQFNHRYSVLLPKFAQIETQISLNYKSTLISKMYMPKGTDITKLYIVGVWKDVDFERAKTVVSVFQSKKPNLKAEFKQLLQTDYEFGIMELKKNPKFENSLLRYMKISASPLIIANDIYIIKLKDIYDILYENYEWRDSTHISIYNRKACTNYHKFFQSQDHKKIQYGYMDLTVNQERHAYPYRIVFEVYLDKAPHSAHRFLNLLKSGHYKGTKVNKIWQDGFIQGGKGEHHSEEKYHEDENYVVKHDKPGIIGWANYGKSHTNGTQFYITMSPFSAYDGKYVAFARVVCGFRAVRFINRLPTFGTRPLVEVEISDCGLYGYDLNKLKQKV